MFTPASLVDLLHIGILRKESNKQFLAVINCFTGILSNLYLYVRQRGVKLQYKMDFREIFRSMCLTLDNTAASLYIICCVNYCLTIIC